MKKKLSFLTGGIMLLLLLFKLVIIPQWNFKSVQSYYDNYSFYAVITSLVILICAVNYKKLRALLFNTAFLFLVLACVEEYSIIRNIKNSYDPNLKRNTYSCHLSRPSDTLGYCMLKNIVCYSKEYYKDTLLYDVKYSSDENGQRILPKIIPNSSTRSIVYFGCSFTYGDGLNDNETVPYLVQELAGNSYKIYNFAFTGYGPHQMLAQIETHMVDSIVKFKPYLFIFSTIPDQVRRVVNPVENNRHDPQYKLNRFNVPERFGNFDDPGKKNISFMKEPEVGKYISGLSKASRRKNIGLFTAIIKKSKELLLKKYPGSKFCVVFYDYYSEINQEIENQLVANEIDYYKVSNLIPDYQWNSQKYAIYLPVEGHPAFFLNKQLAVYEYGIFINSDFTDNFKTLDRWSSFPYTWDGLGCELSASQVWLHDSILTLTLEKNQARNEKEYKGAKLVLNQHYKKGKISVTLKNNIAKGTYVGINLMIPWQPKDWHQKGINIEFIGKSLNTASFNVYTVDPVSGNRTYYNHNHELGFNSGEAFHTYSVSWNSDSVSWFIDDKWVFSEKRIHFSENLEFSVSHWLPSKNDEKMMTWLGPLDEQKLPSKFDIEQVTYTDLR